MFNELASIDTVRSIAASALTAGLTNKLGGGQIASRPENITAPDLAQHLRQEVISVGIKTGVGSTIGGEDFSDALQQNIQFAGAAAFGARFSKAIGTLIKTGEINKAQQLIAHALVGCASASIGGASCGGAAVGAALGEAVADLAHSGLGLSLERAAVIGRYAALASALVTADEAIDVTFTNLAASNAISNNFLLPREKIRFPEEYERCGGNPDCQQHVESKWTPISEERNTDFQEAIDEYQDGNSELLEQYHIQDRADRTAEGYEYYEEYPEDFILLPNEKSIFHTFVVSDSGEVINVTTEQLDYKKLIHPIAGYEVVLDENNNIVTDPTNAGTYNYYNPTTGVFDHPLISDNEEHGAFDAVPYFFLGNGNGDRTTFNQRILRNTYWLNISN